MKIILDPSRDGCTIWFVERNSVKYIQGDAMDICKRIHMKIRQGNCHALACAEELPLQGVKNETIQKK